MKTNGIRSLATGAIVGMAAGMLMSPQMDRSSKRKLKRSGKMFRDTAEDMYDNVKGWMK